MLKKLSILTIALLPLASSFAAVNLIDNPGFEIAGTDDWEASYWQKGQPDNHGERNGAAARRGGTGSPGDWGGHASYWHGTIQGTWSGWGNSGSFWQEKPVSPGMNYQASAWFYADTDWNPAAQAIKIEFLDTNLQYISISEQMLPKIGTNWTQISVTGTAPKNAAWARLVIYANNVSSGGALRFDDVAMIEIPPRTVDFNTWTTTITDGCHEYGGWNI